MPDCPKIEKCPFFNDKMAAKPGTAAMYKGRYCRDDNSQCARWMIGAAGCQVPPDLYPNQADRAREFIAAQKKAK
jgi:hypothetical protein